jgi:phosphatidylglycerophosphatase C
VIAPFARRLGASSLIGTRLQRDADGRLTGRLEGPNCRGEEKMVRLKAHYGDTLSLDAAYGDTDGDAAMLKAARRPFMKVFNARP